MSEKNQQVNPLAPAATMQPRSDEEAAAATLQSKELKRKKRIKCAIYIAAFAVFQTAIILLFVMIVMNIKTPKVRLGTVTVQNMEIGTPASPSFNVKFAAQVTVKNSNFGHYKFDPSNVTFLYQGVTVGHAIIPKAKASARSTKKLDVTVEVNSIALPNTTSLGSELSSNNVLTLNSQAKLSGKVEVIKIIKKKKSAKMNCILTFDVSAKRLQNFNCE